MADELVRTLLVIEPTAEAPRNSEGSIIQLADDSLLLGYTRFTGGEADHSTAHLSARTSKDGGVTWSDDALLVETEGDQNSMSVSLLRLKSGEILLFYLVKNNDRDCKPYVRRSSNEMKTLSERVCVTPRDAYHVVNNDRVVQLSSGRIVVPVSLHSRLPGEVWRGTSIMMCLLSDDDGRTWRESRGKIESPPQSTSGLQEPGVVELRDGRLYMWMRIDMGFQYECFSEDGGETWSEAYPSPMASPTSPASIKRVPWSNDLLLVWNDHSGAYPFTVERRTPLCTAISNDEGSTWTNSKVLEDEPDGCYCYTSMMFVGDSVILGYCAGQYATGGLNRLKVTKIHKDWLYS